WLTATASPSSRSPWRATCRWTRCASWRPTREVARSEELGPQLLRRPGRQQTEWDVVDRAGADLARRGEAVHGAGMGHQHRAREAGVALQREVQLHGLIAAVARTAAADHEAAVGHARVIPGQLLGGDE